MKKYLESYQFLVMGLLAICFSLGFTSCGGDDDESDSSSASLLVGSWVDKHDKGDQTVYDYLEFKADGSGVWKSDYYQDEKVVVTVKFPFTYTYTSNLLIIDSENNQQTFVVLSLNKEALVFYEVGDSYNYTFERK